MTFPPRSRPAHALARVAGLRTRAAAIAVGAALAGCGGTNGNPLDNPSSIDNPSVSATGQHLAFAYFQKCVAPIFVAQLQIPSSASTNTCAGSGCHADKTGTGGAFRVVPTAASIDLNDPANTPDVIRASDMYRNYYSAQGEVIVGSTLQSRLLDKPLLLNVLHGGGLIFSGLNDPNAKLIEYWISHPAPQGQDEFSTATYSMFTPPDPTTGTCNTQ